MIVVLAISALLFLGTVGYLIKNAAGIAELFAKRPVEAEPGDLINGPVRARRASRAAVVTALALHVLGLVGLVGSAAVMTGMMAEDHPDSRRGFDTNGLGAQRHAALGVDPHGGSQAPDKGPPGAVGSWA